MNELSQVYVLARTHASTAPRLIRSGFSRFPGSGDVVHRTLVDLGLHVFRPSHMKHGVAMHDQEQACQQCVGVLGHKLAGSFIQGWADGYTSDAWEWHKRIPKAPYTLE